MSFLTPIARAASTPAASGNFLSDNALTIGLVLLLVVMVVFMVRNSRKRKRDAEELQSKFVPGAEVMTQHGIYGTLVSVDDEKNEAVIETTPGTRLRVHRQTIARVIDPEQIAPEEDVVEDEPSEAAATDAPQYGERVAEDAEADAAPAAPAARTRSTTARAGTGASSASTPAKPRTPRRKPAADGDATE